MTRKPGYSLRRDEELIALVERTDRKTLAAWAIDCAMRVMPHFVQAYPDDHRPGEAIAVLRRWMETGVFRMAEIRRASLGAHAAAREAGEDSAARSAARAAGQAVATAHVPAHAAGAAQYALQAVHRASGSPDADAAVAREREWQYRRLLELRGESTP
ncbi:MAG TPA: hypothetical protein VLV30_01850 [Methanomicrobiales archaeon]|nr:hypothetical protein [Methanomicrobiales archaeon]